MKPFLQLCKQIIGFKRTRKAKFASGSLTDRQGLQIIRHKDILTIEETALYLGIPLGVLVEEVGLGHLPGGMLMGEWRFCREALLNHFSIYHGSGPWSDYRIVDEELESCESEVVENLLCNYKNGQRDFSGLDLRGANLSHTNLSQSNFYGSWLSRASFESSILTDVDLRKAHLREANLQNANLSQASLQDADLTEANLKQAFLNEADLRGAILLGIDLTGANLENTKFR